jgi:uncharacterized membrane protein YsdA (DUF1294 family)
MPLLLLAAAAGFACATPVHANGASLRCADSANTHILSGITVLPPGGPCYRPDDCPVDIGRMSQDYLADLTRGRKIICTPAGRSGKVRCTADGKDLSCQMIASGLAKADGDAPDCPVIRAPPKPAPISQAERFAELDWLWPWLIAYLAAVNILTFLAFIEDRRRARKGLNRVADIHLLALTMFGGGLGGFIATQTTGHLRDEEPFASQLVVLLGLQIGAVIGFFAIPVG